MDTLRQGFLVAQAAEKAILRQATVLFEKKAIVNSGPFRYARIDESPFLPFFHQVSTVVRLAHFLVDVQESHGQKRAKHFLLAVNNPQRDTYVLVGTSGPRRGDGGGLSSNFFGANYKQRAFCWLDRPASFLCVSARAV